MSELPLAGRGIAITRPVDQAHALNEGILRVGGMPIAFPLLAIAPLETYDAFDAVIETLPQCGWIVFISSNAVQQGMPRILARFPRLPDTLRVAAIGPATAQELGRYGVEHVLTPANRFDSESLLALPELQDMRRQRVVIVRGVGGRELLAETLRERGAEVAFAECYQRVNPQHDASMLAELWQNGRLHAVVVTSSEALRNLLQLAQEAPWLKGTLVCVNHARIAEAAQARGLQTVLAEAPGDAAMLQCLIQHLQDRTAQ
jgi:uroporphyrinogen-III synthase